MTRIAQFLRSGRGLPTYAAAVLGWMILVILEGAVVRATGSGAGCGNHWPLCNGDVIPHHPRLATVIEFTHRSMTGICSGSVFALILWTFLSKPKGDRARKAVIWSGLLLLLEAFLGAVLVKGGYVERNTSDARVIVQCVHFTNTMLLLGAISLAWWWQRPRALPGRGPVPGWLGWSSLAAVLLTGATGSVAALADTLFPATDLRTAFVADFASSSPLLVRMRWIHPAASLAAFVLIILLATRLGTRGRQILLALLGAQIILGAADVFTLAPLTLQVLHLLGADLLWVALVTGQVGLETSVDPARSYSASHVMSGSPLLAERS